MNKGTMYLDISDDKKFDDFIEKLTDETTKLKQEECFNLKKFINEFKKGDKNENRK